MAILKIFKDIDELVTFLGGDKKQGRHIKEKDLGVIKKGAFISKNGRIVWVGVSSKLSSSLIKGLGGSLKEARETSFKGHSVLPAFVESHTHSIFAGDRSEEFERRNQGVSYQEIAQKGGGILSTVKATRKASLEELSQLGQQRALNFLGQGVSTLEIKSGYALDMKNEIKMLRAARSLKKLRTYVSYLGPHAVAKEFASGEDYLQFVLEKVLPRVAQENLADRVDIFIEQGYFDLDQGQRFIEAAHGFGLSSTIHADQLTNNHGAMLGHKLNSQSVDHLVQLNSREIKALGNSQTTCVLLPGADLYLKMKYPKARNLIDAGARVALATDFNPGSCPTQDISLIGLLARLEMKMSLPEVIGAYTLGGAWALGMGHDLGALVSGKFCDFTVFNDSWRSLFYKVGYHPVRQVWKQGQRIWKG